MMPSKSPGKRCASISASRPPSEQPTKYDRAGSLEVSAAMMALALSVVSLSAREPKSMIFSGCPSAHAALVPPATWPSSVPAVA